jgi:hypothetical protein
VETGKDFVMECGCVSEFVHGKYILIQCEECEANSEELDGQTKIVKKTKMRTYREI